MQSAADAYTALKNYQAPDAQSVLAQAQNQYGVGTQQSRVSDLRSGVQNLQSSLEAVDPSVTGRTSGTFTTEGQRAALVNKEQAPIQNNLSKGNTALGTAQTDLNTAQSNANTYASAIMTQNQQNYQKLLDQYNAASAYEKEQQAAQQAAQTQALEQAKLNEQIREANMKTSSGGYLPSVTSASASTPQAFSSFKNGKDASGGTAFTNSNGQSISAAKYAQLTGNSVASVIQKLAQGGDRYAQQAYNEIANNQGWYSAHPEVLKSEFAPLFWGT